jgi:hypothetical protein
VAFADAERRDQAIDRFSHRSTLSPQRSVVLRCRTSQSGSSKLEQLQLSKLAFDCRSRRLVPHALQHLAQNHVCNRERLSTQLGIDPIRFRISHAAEVVDPNGRVDNDHVALLRAPTRAGSFEGPFPRHLASQSPNAALAPRLNQQAQTLFNRRALRPSAAAAHRLVHQVVVDVDVRSHDWCVECA